MHSLRAMHTMTVSELVDHGEAASAPIAHYRRGNGNPSTQNGLQESPDEVPPPPEHAHTDRRPDHVHLNECKARVTTMHLHMDVSDAGASHANASPCEECYVGHFIALS